MMHSELTKDFFTYQAQTTPHPLAIEISHALGCHVYDTKGNTYLDFVAGVSACSLGHRHPEVVRAIKKQLDRYLHVMVYGEYVQEPAVALTKLLAQQLPNPLEKIYLTNSGTEAIEGAMKLARRVTGRSQIIAAHNAYHGNTMGAMSAMGFEERKQAFRPLIPDIAFIHFNRVPELEQITSKTAAVLLETIQGGAGFILPEKEYLSKVRERCTKMGALLILDEIQPGFGRTGKLFGFENYNIVPDIVVMGKGMGGGMPVGAFAASSTHMDQLQVNPKLGHITTFGGHPVVAAACLATLGTLMKSDLMSDCLDKEQLFRKKLVHPAIQDIRGIGLMLAIITPSAQIATQLVLTCKQRGLLLFWLLFEPRAVRITPPLTITRQQIEEGCAILVEVLKEIYNPKN